MVVQIQFPTWEFPHSVGAANPHPKSPKAKTNTSGRIILLLGCQGHQYFLDLLCCGQQTVSDELRPLLGAEVLRRFNREMPGQLTEDSMNPSPSFHPELDFQAHRITQTPVRAEEDDVLPGGAPGSLQVMGNLMVSNLVHGQTEPADQGFQVGP